ncbi:DUF5814 domain-containing protein [Methanothermobacter tenebrarum]|uniref:DEAD/DEAH box helicase n=1 Tax=Methanothermobacter tenebrarum TaxID=680118 RepID=A0A328P8A6_9EURY|nr:DUF5814 domain-containing protein [Methanothermobacter tenebrarum]NPV64816.1 DEAD/DEAH box helicase [Methanobacteriaceae archaeon]RAO78578.1 DEAD/DEAH box helicase [Methanothermobacter tenebrarum]
MIVLNRKKRIIELLPIGKAKGALNSRRRPLFQGHIRLTRTSKGPRIKRFIIKKGKKEKPTPPAEAIKLLRKQLIFLPRKDKEIEEFLESLNIKNRYARICQHCLLEGYVTIITPRSSFQYNKQWICKQCADEVIKREIKYNRMDKTTFKNFKRLLQRTKDLEKVLKVFEPRFDPLKNPNLTLFDKITSSTGEKNPIFVDELQIPQRFKTILKKHGNRKLLPVQKLAIEEGLLEGEDLLIVSATASGKTLIGELAGIPKALEGKRFMFLTPLVALANQKYHDFKSKYEKIGLKTAIKVGMNRVKARGELVIPDTDIKGADIIVGTYEGIDFILRSNKSNILKELGVVVIDEIHTLDDEERGSRLNGMISRLKRIFPEAQIIALSATIDNPKEIASEFNLKLIEYDKRPVTLERHLAFPRNEEEKKDLITRLTTREFKNISNKGFHGQSIIFTNSRRKTRLIADYLQRRGIKAEAYHAGLPYRQRRKIEKKFASQQLAAVVTTAALAAGVDFPASQVIFETLLMGNRWITPNEFSQMLGRAGRPSYHDRGIVYLLPEVGMSFDGETEESKAIELLETSLDPVNVYYTKEDVTEQLLADISSGAIKNIKDLEEKPTWPISPKEALEILESYGLIIEDDGRLKVTDYGMAVSKSFLKCEEADYIKENLDSMNPLEIALSMEPFENAYLSNRLHNQLTHRLKVKFSNKLFADSTLDIISNGDNIIKLDEKLQEALINIQIDFLSCECKERPFCDCIQDKLSEYIVKMRLRGKDPADISRLLLKRYQIQAYSGDIFNWLDSLLRILESIKRIASASQKHDKVKESSIILQAIETGEKCP